VGFQPGHSPAGFDRHPIEALDAFERATDGNRLAAGDFERGTEDIVGLGLIGPAQLAVGQAAEVIGPRIAAAGIDRRRQALVGLL
jgi:hypothetical protein